MNGPAAEPDLPMERLAAPMGRTAAHGAAWLGMAQAFRVLLTFVSTAVLARLLTPGDYGLIAMTAPVFALIGVFSDLGLTSATIQARDLSPARSTAMFWLTVTVSLGLALLAVAAAPGVAWFYGDARAGLVTAAGAASLLVGGLSLQHSALLNREMRFATLSLIEVTGLVVTTATAIALALILHNYWALVLGTLAGVAVQSALTWYCSGFRPGAPRLAGIGDLARFGGHLTGFNLVNFLARNLDTVLVAHHAGPAQAGLYDRSYRLLTLPLQTINGPVTRLLQPMLSRLREEPARYRRMFLLALRAVVLASAPPALVVVALSGPVMSLLLGAKWLQAGPIFFWLGLAGVLQPIANLLGVLFLTTGRPRALMHWSLATAPVTLGGFVLAIPYGAVGMAMAFFLTSVLLTPARFWWATRHNPVRQSDRVARADRAAAGRGRGRDRRGCAGRPDAFAAATGRGRAAGLAGGAGHVAAAAPKPRRNACLVGIRARTCPGAVAPGDCELDR